LSERWRYNILQLREETKTSLSSEEPSEQSHSVDDAREKTLSISSIADEIIISL